MTETSSNAPNAAPIPHLMNHNVPGRKEIASMIKNPKKYGRKSPNLKGNSPLSTIKRALI